MQHEAEIELELWAYLDGSLATEDHNRIEQLVRTDSQWQAKFSELSALHQSLLSGLETEEPSMRFSKNVMDAIAKESIAPALKSYLNPWVIRGIAAAFLIMTGILLLSVQGTGGLKYPHLTLPSLKMPAITGSAFSYGVMFLLVIAGLLFADSLLRKKIWRQQ